MAVKIICNGKINDIKIIDVASGVELQADCTKAYIILDSALEHPEVVLHFTDVQLDLTGEVVETIPPVGMTLGDVKAG